MGLLWSLIKIIYIRVDTKDDDRSVKLAMSETRKRKISSQEGRTIDSYVIRY